MPFEIIRNDLTNMKADAIVNTANPRPLIGTGVDSGIHRKAGPLLLIARKAIGSIACGDAAVTPAFGLNAKYVIHTVSPSWKGGTQNELSLLKSCYTRSLELALKHSCKSVAFPLLASGNLGFPKDLALQIAVNVFSDFLMKHDMKIYLAVFDESAFALSEKLFHSVQSFIDSTYIEETFAQEYLHRYNVSLDDRMRQESPDFMRTFSMPAISMQPQECSAPSVIEKELTPLPPEQATAAKAVPHTSGIQRKYSRSLEDLVRETEETFSEHLLRLIDQKGLTDPEVYKKANIDRKLFSKIRNHPDYRPGKSTALAFAIALELNLDETKDLIGRAGYALTHSSKFDIIVEYCILEQKYNIFEVNEILFAFHQPAIGA